MKKNLIRAMMGVATMLCFATAQAAIVVWDASTDSTWTEPDTTSWSAATYNSGDSAQFLGAGLGTITIGPGGVTPGSVLMSGAYTLVGDTISGTAALSIPASGAILANTNTYSGNTSILAGTLVVQGKDALSPNSKIYMQRFTGLSLMMDDAGTVNLGNEVEVHALDTSSGITTRYTITVANNGGATTNSTLKFGKVDFHGGGGNYSSARIVVAEGSNGYGVEFGDVDMNLGSAHTGLYQAQGFAGFTAPITISGTVKQINGNSGNTIANYLYLGGSHTDNQVTGLIKDPDDYPGNASAQALVVRINGGNAISGTETAEWTFSNTNSYSGGTFINNGKLHANATNALGFGDVQVTSTSGDLVINSEGAMSDDVTLTLPDNTTETLTMNANMTIAALILGVSAQPNGEYTSAESWMGGSGTLTVGSGGLFYWDIDGTTAGAGGATPSGTWDVGSSANWDSTSSAGTGAAATWPGGVTNTAIFSAGTDAVDAYTVTVSGTPDIGGLTFEEGDVTLSGGTLRMVADNVVFVAGGSTTTVSTVLAEDATARSLSKSGSGDLVLSAANTYSGVTTISEGSVEATVADAVRGSAIAVGNGASLKATAAGAIDGGDISLAGGATLHLTDPDAIADAAGVTIEATSANWVRDTDIAISNLTFNKGNGNDTAGYVIGGNALNFISGGTIDSTYASAETISFTCQITGSPEVRIAELDQNKITYFSPAVGTTQTLGKLVNPYNHPVNGGDKTLVYLDGTSTDSTIEEITWETHRYGYMHKIGTGTWTVNGDVKQGYLQVDAGTMIINGTFESQYQGIKNITGKLGGDLNIGTASFRAADGSRTLNAAGTLSPGDGGVGTINFEWLGSGVARTFTFADSSTYEWDAASAASTDVINLEADNNFTLDLDNFVLKIADDTGLGYIDPPAQLTVFTYDSANVVIDMAGFGNTAANFDATGLGPEWDVGTLSLTDDGSGTIYLSGLTKPEPAVGVIFKLK